MLHTNENEKITKTEFQAKIASGITLVDFWAPWCGPCRMMSPIVDELAVELKDKANIIKVNVDENHDLASEFGITSIPSLLLFKNGKKINQMVGAQSKPNLKQFIESAF